MRDFLECMSAVIYYKFVRLRCVTYVREIYEDVKCSLLMKMDEIRLNKVMG